MIAGAVFTALLWGTARAGTGTLYAERLVIHEPGTKGRVIIEGAVIRIISDNGRGEKVITDWYTQTKRDGEIVANNTIASLSKRCDYEHE